jgi:MoaA/NifB/PqqE/SkfB family radical SAM enzyme
MPLNEVVAAAKAAKDKGASRFCMGAAWKGPKDNDLDRVLDMVREVKALGMQTCVTLGMLKDGQAEKLKEAGLDYYNHNLDTDKEFTARSSRRTPMMTASTRSNRCAMPGSMSARGHHRHGRITQEPRWSDRPVGQPAEAAGIRADQQSGADSRDAAGR